MMMTVEAPHVSVFRAQLKSVLETLLNDAVREITRVYVDTSVAVTTMEGEDSPQEQSSPSCKAHSFAPEVPASPPHRAATPEVPASAPHRAATPEVPASAPHRAATPEVPASAPHRAATPEVPASAPHRAATPGVPFKEEGSESEPHPPFQQQPQIILVSSLARKDTYTQTDSSSVHLQPPISTTRPPTSTAPVKREIVEVCHGTQIDQDRAEVPEPQNTDVWEQVSRRGARSKDIPNEDGAVEEPLDMEDDDERPGPSAFKGNTDTDWDRGVSGEDPQERVASQQETCEQLVLRARSVPRRPSTARRKSGCNLRMNGTEMNPDETSRMSQTSAHGVKVEDAESSTSTQTSERCGPSILVEVHMWNVPNEDGLDEEQPDNMHPPPVPSALKENTDTDQTSVHAKRLKSCSVQLVRVNPFVCHICSKTFKCKRFLRRHVRFHTGEKPYLCEQCGRSFALKVNLKHHQTVHNNEESPPFRCEYCVKQFCSKSKLDVHVRIHTGEKPHRCIFCKKKHYRLKKNLVKHMLKHLGYAPAVDQKRKLHK